MYKQILFSVMLLGSHLLQGQSVGIGTTSPDPKAALEISSTNKGLLIPSMTTNQRNSIASPPDGLMVYDTDLHLFYHYDGTNWRKITNSTFWNNSSTRNYVYNTTDSIGIGTSVPTERLDVNGNVRFRDDLQVDGSTVVTGNIASGSMSTGGTLAVGGNAAFLGNVTVNGTTTANGTINTDGPLNIDNSAAILQLKNAGVNRGFFQLSGDNVRLGTNSGNTVGNLVIRMNGADRVTVDEVGNINITGEINKFAQSGFAALTPICYGMIRANGTIVFGTGNFTAQRSDEGWYKITCPGVTFGTTVVFTMCTGRNSAAAGGPDPDNDGIIDIFTSDENFDPADRFFYFIAYRM